MKFPMIAVVVLFASSLMAQTADPVLSFHSRGTFAQLFTFQNGSDILLTVTRNGEAGDQAATLLSYSIFSSTATGFTDTFAFGLIPNESLQGGNDKHVGLNVDTSQISSFQSTTCTFDFTTFTNTCKPGTLGLVQLDWQQDGNSSSHLIANQQQTFFQFTTHEQRNTDAASATANGSVVGIPVKAGFSTIGTNHDSLMEFFKN